MRFIRIVHLPTQLVVEEETVPGGSLVELRNRLLQQLADKLDAHADGMRES